MARTRQKKRRGGRRPVETMTEAQRRTYDAVRDYIGEHGMSPTIRELADELGLAMTPVNDSVSHLVRKGYLSRTPHKARSLAIAREPDDEKRADDGFISIDLYGVVAAGHPVVAEENRLGKAMVPAKLVQNGTYFALEVQGDSMKGAGIHSGDMVIVRQQQLAEDGDVVVAWIDGESTLKRLRWTKGGIELRPENRKFKPIRVSPDADLRVFGVVVEKCRHKTTSPRRYTANKLAAGTDRC